MLARQASLRKPGKPGSGVPFSQTALIVASSKDFPSDLELKVLISVGCLLTCPYSNADYSPRQSSFSSVPFLASASRFRTAAQRAGRKRGVDDGNQKGGGLKAASHERIRHPSPFTGKELRLYAGQPMRFLSRFTRFLIWSDLNST